MKIKKVEAKKTVVYCGPSIPGIVRRNKSFVNGVLPDDFQEFVNEHPIFKELIVPANELAETNRQLRNPHSSISVFFEKAQLILSKGG